MTLYIAILPGINVRKKRNNLMKDLRELCDNFGYKNVQTYIQIKELLNEVIAGAQYLLCFINK